MERFFFPLISIKNPICFKGGDIFLEVGVCGVFVVDFGRFFFISDATFEAESFSKSHAMEAHSGLFDGSCKTHWTEMWEPFHVNFSPFGRRFGHSKGNPKDKGTGGGSTL